MKPYLHIKEKACPTSTLIDKLRCKVMLPLCKFWSYLPRLHIRITLSLIPVLNYLFFKKMLKFSKTLTNYIKCMLPTTSRPQYTHVMWFWYNQKVLYTYPLDTPCLSYTILQSVMSPYWEKNCFNSISLV